MYSAADIDKALKGVDINPHDFKSLYPSLTQLAKRRKRIVHNADFLNPTDTSDPVWSIADYWELCMWNLAVLCFYYRLLTKLEPENTRVRERHDQMVQAMADFVQFGHQMIALSKSPPQSILDDFERMNTTLTVVLGVLNGS